MPVNEEELLLPMAILADERKTLNEYVAGVTIYTLLELGATLAEVKSEWIERGMSAEEADGYINRWLWAEET
jgi:hypothetical protein